MPRGRVIVTRPARDAASWMDGLRAAGIDAMALPLIAIEPLLDPADLEAARRHVSDYAALMFVSAAAADFFFEGFDKLSLTRAPRCWATGPGTSRALKKAGVSQACIDAPAEDSERFDSEGLWNIVRTQVGPGTRVLIIRGGDETGQPTGRDWLAREVASAGGVCDVVVAYRRLAPDFGESECRLACESAQGLPIWLFSSSEAIVNLRRAMPSNDWRGSRAIATHERIAKAARDAGFGQIRVSQPSLAALLASIESFA